MDFWISEWISGFQIGFLDFRIGFLDFTVDFWISVWISADGVRDFWPLIYGDRRRTNFSAFVAFSRAVRLGNSLILSY